MQQRLFSYDDVYLVPKYSELDSRSDGDTSIEFLGQKWKLPVVPANMQDVISWKLACGLQLNQYFYIMHRFDDANLNVPEQIPKKTEGEMIIKMRVVSH